ncbi:MAG TPA: NADAR family protein [Ktedonobacterales bacterium]
MRARRSTPTTWASASPSHIRGGPGASSPTSRRTLRCASAPLRGPRRSISIKPAASPTSPTCRSAYARTPARWRRRCARKHAAETRPDWEAVRVPIMRWCLAVKLAQHRARFGGLLLATGDRPLVEVSPDDAFWGAVPAGPGARSATGANLLGHLLMELRATLPAPTGGEASHGEDEEGEWVPAPPTALGLRLLGQLIVGERAATHPCARPTPWRSALYGRTLGTAPAVAAACGGFSASRRPSPLSKSACYTVEQVGLLSVEARYVYLSL